MMSARQAVSLALIAFGLSELFLRRGGTAKSLKTTATDQGTTLLILGSYGAVSRWVRSENENVLSRLSRNHGHLRWLSDPSPQSAGLREQPSRRSLRECQRQTWERAHTS